MSQRVGFIGDHAGTLEELRATTHRNLRGIGTVTRYRTTMSDHIEREVIHGRLHDHRRRAGRSADLTMASAPPLSMGPDGLMMHFLIKAMEAGTDVVVFGPERASRDVRTDRDERDALANRLSLANTAHAAHVVADHLQQTTGADLSHLVWAGVSLGAIKGISFAALAPERRRTMVYSHFVAPVCPEPMNAPDAAAMRRYMLGELGAMFRSSGELMLKDARDRSLRMFTDVAALARPGLLARYARSAPRDSEFRAVTKGWQRSIVGGDPGRAALALPPEKLTTFELFDQDNGNPPEAWHRLLAPQLGRGIRILDRHGHHSDSIRLSHQRRRARIIQRVVDAVAAGTPIEELAHPLDG